MFIIHIISLFIFILILACIFRRSFVEALPVGISCLVLLLYVLCYGRHLGLIDVIAPVFLAVVLLFGVTCGKERRKELGKRCVEILKEPTTIAGIVLLVVVSVCVSQKIVTWWDDYNFWATDVKSVYYQNGFSGRYANAASEFGDYPPGTQMMKWWFLHLSPEKFQEGLLFAGYYFFNLSFLLPLLSFIRRKTPLTVGLMTVLLWLFPTMVEVFWCDGCCADFSMAVVYGAFLTAVLDQKEDSSVWYYGRQTLYLMVLVLCKNTGFVWLAFALLFAVSYHLLRRRKEQNVFSKKVARRGLTALFLLPMLAEGSWLLFCYVNRRVAKLTGAAVQMATGSMSIPEIRGQLLQVFGEAFIKWPLHRSYTWLIDLSPLLFILLFVVVWGLLIAGKKTDRRTGCFLVGYLVLTGVLDYMIILVSHLTIFATEEQYLEPYAMVSSISRYGAPFTIGGLYLLLSLVLPAWKDNRGLWIAAGVILLTSDYQSAYRALWGYRTTIQDELARREEILDDAAWEFVDKVGGGAATEHKRVLYVRDISDVSWVRNTYINFEASPVPVMYANVDLQNTTKEDILRLMEEAHAQSLYLNGELYDLSVVEKEDILME